MSGEAAPRKSRVPGFLFALTVVALSATTSAAWDPPGWRVQDPAPQQGSTNAAALPLEWALRAYRGTVSRVDGDRCPSYPTCSTYALEAVRRHGLLLGAALTAGRLEAESDEAAFAPRIFVGGKWKVYSPVDDDLAFLRGRLDP